MTQTSKTKGSSFIEQGVGGLPTPPPLAFF
jgi:hypothetical protein